MTFLCGMGGCGCCIMPMGFCLVIIMLASGKRNSLAVVMLLHHEKEGHHDQDIILGLKTLKPLSSYYAHVASGWCFTMGVQAV